MLNIKKIKVLFLAPLPPPSGGIATWMKTLQENGIGEGFVLDSINTNLKGKRKVFEKAKINFTEFKRNISILAQLFLKLICNRPRIIDYSCSLSPRGLYRDLVCVTVARLFLVPIIVRFRGSASECYVHKLNHHIKLIFKLINRVASAVVVEDSRSLSLVNTFGIKERTSLCPNFLSDTFFKVHSFSKNIQAIEDSCFKLHLVFIGGVTQAKGILELVELAQHYPIVKFSIVGEIKADMQAMNIEAGFLHNITFYGYLQDSEVEQLLSTVDGLIHPSHTEGFSLTVLEAMARGFPVICSNVGALPDMIDSGKGGFSDINPGDIQSFKKAIDYFLAHPQQCTEMGDYNYQKSFQHYRYSAVIKEIQSLYYKLL